jgi:hypothetical protein
VAGEDGGNCDAEPDVEVAPEVAGGASAKVWRWIAVSGTALIIGLPSGYQRQRDIKLIAPCPSLVAR